MICRKQYKLLTDGKQSRVASGSGAQGGRPQQILTMRQDFSTVPEPETDLVTVPPGRYLCRVRQVHERRTRDGASVQWAVVLDVAEGTHAGHLAAWDNLTFSDRGLPRVKLALRAFGFDVSGVLDLEPGEMQGRRAVVELVEQQWVNPDTGHTTRRLGVPYAGYAHATTWDGDPGAPEGPAEAEGAGGPGTAAAGRMPW